MCIAKTFERRSLLLSLLRDRSYVSKKLTITYCVKVHSALFRGEKNDNSWLWLWNVIQNYSTVRCNGKKVMQWLPCISTSLDKVPAHLAHNQIWAFFQSGGLSSKYNPKVSSSFLGSKEESFCCQYTWQQNHPATSHHPDASPTRHCNCVRNYLKVGNNQLA